MNEVEQLRTALRIAAEAAYQSEVADTLMETLMIGKDKVFASRDEWVESRIQEWLEEAGK